MIKQNHAPQIIDFATFVFFTTESKSITLRGMVLFNYFQERYKAILLRGISGVRLSFYSAK